VSGAVGLLHGDRNQPGVAGSGGDQAGGHSRPKPGIQIINGGLDQYCVCERSSDRINPGGKLPLTIPRHVGQVPIHHGQRWGTGYRRTKADIHKGYLDMPSTPKFVFGHGLSYTTFDHGPLELQSDTVDVSGQARSPLTVTNSGSRRGTEVVQLYAADTATGVTLPAQQLVGFGRVDLEPGASKTVTFTVPLRPLGYMGTSGAFVMEPGPMGLSAGSSSDDIRSTATFTVTGETRTIKR
jgi:beta-xylosidase